MSLKRRNTSSPEPEDYPIKRRSISYEYDSDDSDVPDVDQKPQIDATTGQSGAFPGLGNDDELFYGPAADGMDYLRMVR
jgi:regulator of vacuolar morphogenesis